MVEPALLIKIIGNNRQLLPKKYKCSGDGVIRYSLKRRASLKDIIEALGIPHTEVGEIRVNGVEAEFEHIPDAAQTIEILPFSKDITVTAPSLLRPKTPLQLRFLADINVLKLARILRMLGVDTSHASSTNLRVVAEEALQQKRMILTRNKELLKLKSIDHGQLLRSEEPEEQLHEVLERFGCLQTDSLSLFSRCLDCNGKLYSVNKQEVLHLLEPLTKKYYNEFSRCSGCQKIYWKGTHYEKMLKIIERLTAGSS